MHCLVQKSFLTKNYLLAAERNLPTRGLLYTCLVVLVFFSINLNFLFLLMLEILFFANDNLYLIALFT